MSHDMKQHFGSTETTVYSSMFQIPHAEGLSTTATDSKHRRGTCVTFLRIPW